MERFNFFRKGGCCNGVMDEEREQGNQSCVKKGDCCKEKCIQRIVGPRGPVSMRGSSGPRGPQGPAGEAGPNSGSGIERTGPDTFNLSDIGTYQIFFQVSVDEAGQLILTLRPVSAHLVIVQLQ